MKPKNEQPKPQLNPPQTRPKLQPKPTSDDTPLQIPAWLQNAGNWISDKFRQQPPYYGGKRPTMLPPRPGNNMGMPYNRTPAPPQVGGTYYNPIQGANSFLGGGGWLARGKSGAVFVPPPGVNTFQGGGGNAVRGPDESNFLLRGGGDNSNNNPPNYWGGGWGGGGGGGGGWGWDDWDRSSQYQYPPNMGLFSWNYRG